MSESSKSWTGLFYFNHTRVPQASVRVRLAGLRSIQRLKKPIHELYLQFHLHNGVDLSNRRRACDIDFSQPATDKVETGKQDTLSKQPLTNLGANLSLMICQFGCLATSTLMNVRKVTAGRWNSVDPAHWLLAQQVHTLVSCADSW